MEQRVGLAIMRLQPLHRGHCLTINEMIQKCEVAIIGLGSTNKKPDQHDPFTPDVRMQMIRNVYGDRVKIVPLVDLNAANKTEWVEYVFQKLNKLGMPEPTDYFTGSEADAVWYDEHFAQRPNVLEYGTRRHWVNDKNEKVPIRLLHIVNRHENDIPSASEIRSLINLRTDKWKQWIPYVNHRIIEDNYPEEYLVPA
jgi:nicotinamide mononucleotide adenylyltransferase